MIAKVVIDSTLPQLDRIFEYQVPENMQHQITEGIRVKVAVGHTKKLYEAYVVAMSDEAQFQGTLAEIQSVVSTVPVLTKEIFELASRLAKRQAATVAEILKSAIPNRSIGVEKGFESQVKTAEVMPMQSPKLQALQISVIKGENDLLPHWCEVLSSLALDELARGSVVIALPTDNQLELLKQQLNDREIEFIDFSSAQTPSKRYLNFLNSLFQPKQLVVGNRNALYAPVPDLACLIVWEESDFSHADQSSPYLHSRDIALLRQDSRACNLYFASIGISTEIARLIDLKYLELKLETSARPKIAYEENSDKSDSLIFRTIKTALATGPVLVQVSAVGHSVALYCKKCQQKVKCRVCSGPLWMNSVGRPICRWCAALNYDAKCANCGENELRQGRAGSTRSVAEFGKAFPGIPVLESTSITRILRIGNKPALVVATPGCEPLAEGGYTAVILHDARNQLSWDSLRSVESAVYAWNRALTYLHSKGIAILAGVGGKLGEQYALWKQYEIAKDELVERIELELPPAIRLGSITGNFDAVQLVADVAKSNGAEVLGPTTLEDGNLQYLFKYSYRAGSDLSQAIKSAILKTGASKNAGSNRNSRNVRVKMDDREVI